MYDFFHYLMHKTAVLDSYKTSKFIHKQAPSGKITLIKKFSNIYWNVFLHGTGIYMDSLFKYIDFSFNQT